MSRQYITHLGHQDTVDEIFLATNKQLRPNRNGNLYLQVNLSDRTGSLNAMMWNANDKIYRGFEDGDYVRVEGTTQLYQGSMQMIATHISRAETGEVNDEEFMPVTPHEVDQLAVRLAEILRSVQDAGLRSLVEAFLADEQFMRLYSRSPAGVKNHHAYLGGLLEHVVNMMEVAILIAPRYPQLDVELLIVGILIHDMGKTTELSCERGFAYTNEGQMVGHIIMAISILDQKIKEAEQLAGEPLTEETVIQLKHMIASHHGRYEYGAAKLPMTLEALTLHHLDNLDAKIHSFEQIMRDDVNAESVFTTYQPNLERKLFKSPKALKSDEKSTSS